MKNFKAGINISQGTYKCFQPEKINKQWIIDDMEVLDLLSRADRKLGKLDMYSEYIPNIDLFIRMHIAKEACMSSKIEGTKTNIDEVLLDKDVIREERREDWVEVQNYITALNNAIERLDDLPISTRLIKEINSTLLQGARGKNKQPGEFRKSQNWIGGASINDAVFIPTSFTSVNEYMSDIEKFIHQDDYFLPDLLKIALIHYQFETVHPFLDGNGRVGRLLITLYLVDKGLISKPILYLSDFLERNRMLYYDNLTRVRNNNDINQWFKFFLVGVIETAESGIQTFDKILKLQRDVEKRILKLGSRYDNAMLIVENLFQNPILDVAKAQKITALSSPSAYKLIYDLVELGIIREITGGKRDKLFEFSDYLKLFK